MQEILLKIRYFERGLSKSQLCFFFQTQSLLMYKVIKNKRGLELLTSLSSGYETSSEKFLYYLYITWPSLICNIKQLLSYFKIYICKFMQANSWHHKLSHFHLSFCIRKVWKGKKIQKLKYLENKKNFLDEIKNIFHSFWRAIIWWKNKKFIKNSGHKL